MFSDKVLHRSKPEEPPLLTRVTVFASIMQSAAVAGGGGGLGGWMGEGEGRWERKRVCDKMQRQK